MSILSTYSIIIFITERYSFTVLSENSRAPGGAPWAELKSDEHLSANHQQNKIMMIHTKMKILCRRVCFFMGTDLEKCSIASLVHHWILCSECLELFWTVLSCKQCLICADFSPDSYQTICFSGGGIIMDYGLVF